MHPHPPFRSADRGRRRRLQVSALALLIGLGAAVSGCTMRSTGSPYSAGFETFSEDPYPFGLPGSGEFDFGLDRLDHREHAELHHREFAQHHHVEHAGHHRG